MSLVTEFTTPGNHSCNHKSKCTRSHHHGRQNSFNSTDLSSNSGNNNNKKQMRKEDDKITIHQQSQQQQEQAVTEDTVNTTTERGQLEQNKSHNRTASQRQQIHTSDEKTTKKIQHLALVHVEDLKKQFENEIPEMRKMLHSCDQHQLEELEQRVQTKISTHEALYNKKFTCLSSDIKWVVSKQHASQAAKTRETPSEDCVRRRFLLPTPDANTTRQQPQNPNNPTNRVVHYSPFSPVRMHTRLNS